MKVVRFETTVRHDRTVALPEFEPGDRVEVIVLRLASPGKLARKGGWAEGKIHILPGFDDPIPGMECYL